MRNFFKRSVARPAFVPPTGPISLTRAQFKTMMRLRPSYTEYAAEIGGALALAALDGMFDEARRVNPNNGSWNPGMQPIAPVVTNLSFNSDQLLATFFDVMDDYLGFDLQHIRGRQTYIAQLRTRRDAGTLYTDLVGATEPEANYYHPRAPVAPRPGAPAVPARPAEQLKAQDWLRHGVHGSTLAFSAAFMNLRKDNGVWPLGRNDQSLRAAWRTLAPGAPAYRGWNMTASQQKYPSDVGGTKLLNDILDEAGARAAPLAGSTGWYDLALCTYGAIMTSQPFTDGNKRACRLAYALILTSGGVGFRAPNAGFGARLADMM